MNYLKIKVKNFIESLGKIAITKIIYFGKIIYFFVDCIKLSFIKPYRFKEIILHIEFIGNKSIGIIAITGLFTGLALTFQIYLGFKLVNAINLVGPTVALGICRELSPVLSGLIVSARAGGAIAARLGTMRVGEQIDAIEIMGIDSKKYLISPRIYAAIISMPILTAIFDFVAIFGCYFLCIYVLNLDEAIFWDKINNTLAPKHIFEGLFKATVFGLIFIIMCCFKGYHTKGGAKGVGEATNQGVVTSMVLIIIFDYFLTNFIRIFYSLMGIS